MDHAVGQTKSLGAWISIYGFTEVKKVYFHCKAYGRCWVVESQHGLSLQTDNNVYIAGVGDVNRYGVGDSTPLTLISSPHRTWCTLL